MILGPLIVYFLNRDMFYVMKAVPYETANRTN